MRSFKTSGQSIQSIRAFLESLSLAEAARLTVKSAVMIAALCMHTNLAQATENPADLAKPDATPKVTMGNGAQNWIITEGATRTGATLIFPEVQIEKNGWLVLHPFENGKPNGNVVAAYAPLSQGISKDVKIELADEPSRGDLFIVMLHEDKNENGAFDFVFVNEREVVDAAVFEARTMIGHVYATP
ncbi:MAG: hypothetical protein AAF098_09450 [Pseudomonadota bacterium]